MKRYDWDCRQILRFCTIVAFVSALCLGIVLMGCDGRRVGRYSCHILTLSAIGSTIWPYDPQPIPGTFRLGLEHGRISKGGLNGSKHHTETIKSRPRYDGISPKYYRTQG